MSIVDNSFRPVIFSVPRWFPRTPAASEGKSGPPFPVVVPVSLSSPPPKNSSLLHVGPCPLGSYGGHSMKVKVLPALANRQRGWSRHDYNWFY